MQNYSHDQRSGTMADIDIWGSTIRHVAAYWLQWSPLDISNLFANNCTSDYSIRVFCK